ncbi:MAG: class II aldolase/adducin family protein [Gemmatimonadota bacterium]|nr:class II aldolase/adducin family protein [Gemmatimonadota bacterium]
MGPSIADAKREIVDVGRRLWQRGLVGGSEGNVSVRLDGGRLVTTPSGACKGFLEPDDLVVTDLDGRPLGEGRPSSELKMHVAIYGIRDDVRAVVHAHPPTATGFAIAGESFDECVVPEVIATLGRVPLVPYGTPSTAELPERIAPWVPTHDALLLANHGAVAYAKTLARAIDVMESLEQAARSLLTARLLGRVRRLSREEVDRLTGLDAYGVAVRNPGCTVADPEPLASRGVERDETAPVGARENEPAAEIALRERISAIVRETLDGGGR